MSVSRTHESNAVPPEQSNWPERAAEEAARAREAQPAVKSGLRRRNVLAVCFALVVGAAILVGFSAAWTFPEIAPSIAVGMVALCALAFSGAARLDQGLLKKEIGRLNARLEGMADAEWELLADEESYRSLVDAQGDLVMRRDTSGKVTFANAAFAAAFGKTPDAIVGKHMSLVPKVSPAAASKAPAARDVHLLTAGGWRWYTWVDIRVRDEVYSVARDITFRKDAEQALVEARTKAEAASEAKSRVLATVSHEFRTPLNGILGLTGLLRETDLTPDQETYASAVHSSGEALLALVDDMLDFSKIEAGRLDLHPEPTDVEVLLQEIAELLAGRAHVKGIDIAVDVARDLPRAVVVDPARLRQVLINLAGNGVKFTETGGVTLSAARASDGAIIFAVSDTGPGIPAADAERLFDEFEQMDKALSRRHGGAGLGLAISRRIVRRMGGDIIVSPGEAGGSVFSFTLDLPAASPETVGAQDAAPFAARSILVVAPEGAEPPVIARALSAAGATVRIARTAMEAAALAGAAAAAGERHDLALIDARLAQGAEAALGLIREAAGHRLPATVVIDPSRRHLIESLKAADFDAYLVRPVRRSSLVRIVGDVLSGAGGFQVDPGDARPRASAAARRLTSGMHVLLAEDNEINALLARAVLEGQGHIVTEVRDGLAAVAAVKDATSRFDAIVMDLHMPGLDGLGAIRAIRALEAERGDSPAAILAVTADVLAETRVAANAAGVDAMIEKPMTPDTLRGALDKLAAA